MAENKKYLDYAGLTEFWSLVKNYYSDTVSKAASAIQGVYVLNRGSESSTPIEVIDSKVTIDLHDYAKLSDIAQGVNFKGVVATYDDLPSFGNVAGDIYYVKDRSKEYIWVPENTDLSVEAHWEELGNIAALDNYYTKSEIDGLFDAEVTARNDAISTAVGAETQAREDADASLGERIDNEAATRLASDEELQASIAAEREARMAADAAEIIARDEAIENAFESGNYVIKLHEIRKLFGEEKVVTSEDFVEAIGEAGIGDTIILNSSAVISQPIQIPANGDITIELGESGSINSGSGRAINVGENSTVEIVGGTVTCDTGNYGIVCAANSSIIVDGTSISNDGSGVAIGTNGLNYNGDIIIRNATVTGTNYFPACGNLIIENSTISVPVACDDSCAIYCKSGSITITNSVFEASAKNNGDWLHNNNGYIGISCAAIFENCNYGGHGNMKIDIDSRSQFIVHNAPAGATYENFGILVIDYNGNTSESIKIDQKYYHAEVSNKVTAPYVHFTTDTSVVDPDHTVVFVTEVNG